MSSDTTASLLRDARALAERRMIAARTAVLLLLAVLAVFYGARVPRSITLVNVGVMSVMVLWTLLQYAVLRRPTRLAGALTAANSLIEIAAVTVVLLGYAWAGDSQTALGAPVWVAYFVILAGRPFMGSARQAAVAAGAAAAAFGGVLVILLVGRRLPEDGGAALLNYGSELLLLIAAGVVTTYATAWNEHTVSRATAALRAREAELGAILGAMAEVVIVLDDEGRYVKIAPTAEDRLVREASALLGRRMHDVLDRETADRFLEAIRRSLASGGVVELEYEMETAGARRWFLSAVSPMTERQVVWVARDITARREMEAALRASEERYRLFFEASPRPMWVYDAESLAFLAVNDAATREYGWSREEFLAMTLRDIRPPEDIPALDEDVVRADDGHGATRTWRHITRSGRLVMVEISSHPIVFAGRPARLVLVNDVTTQLAAAEAVRASEARFRAIFDHAALGIILMDLDGTVRATNPAFQRLLGLSAAELRRASRAELAQLAESESTRGVVRDIVDQVRESATLEKRYVRVDGEVVWVSLTVSRADADGRGRLIGMVQDITDRKALEAQLLHQAFHDPLTGLANRALFRDRVEHALARAERERNRVAVLFLDLDDFKAVNDTRGHAEGDRLLADIAQRLLNATRGCDTVARLGGDEFAVLLENVREDGDAVVVAERVHASLLPPSDLAGSPVAVSASIGIARAGDGDGAEELLRNADVAMYMAKNAGKGRHVLYAPAMHTALVDRLVLAADLRHAVERAELRLHYQPIVALATGRIVGLEALVRWQHPLRGLLLPGAFISEAEESGYIESLGRWVLREACRQAVALERERARSGVLAHGPALTMAVNLSARQLASETLVADITEALATSGLHPASLVLEITESTIVDQSSAALETLRAIKTLGVKLAIDDFGTGYSSLSYLQRFPLDTIKIDKAFVDGMARGGNHVALTRTIIALGDMLSLRTVAEGVETEQQRTMLLELGCECAQGHLFAEALAADELTRRLTADYADELTDSAAATAEH